MKTREIYHYGLLLACVVWLSGCKEEEEDYISKYCPGSCTEVNGQVLRANGQSMANVQLSANWVNLRTFKSGLGGTVRKKAVAYTDAQGHYTLRFLLRDDELLEGNIEVTPQGVLCSQSTCQPYTLYFDELKRDTTYTYDFVID